MCRNTIGAGLTPSDRAASTWSDSRWASICPRSNRANTGICGIDDRDDHAGQVRVGEQHADRDRQQQTGNRQHDVDDPHDDGVDPATEGAGQRCPRISPPISPIRVAKTPTSRVCRAPTINRENRSRPWVSPPSGKPGCDGAIALRAVTVWPISSWAPGRAARSTAPMMASSTNSAMITAPTQNSGDDPQPRPGVLSSEVPSSSEVTSASMRCLRAREIGGGHQRVLIRGSTSAYARSTMVLMTTNAAAAARMITWTTG